MAGFLLIDKVWSLITSGDQTTPSWYSRQETSCLMNHTGLVSLVQALYMTSRRLQLMWFNSIRNVHMWWRHEIKVVVTPVYGPTLYRLSINLGMGSDANRFGSPRVRTRMEQVTILLLWKFPWQTKVGVARTSCAIWQSLQRYRVPVSYWLRKTVMFQV